MLGNRLYNHYSVMSPNTSMAYDMHVHLVSYSYVIVCKTTHSCDYSRQANSMHSAIYSIAAAAAQECFITPCACARGKVIRLVIVVVVVVDTKIVKSGGLGT